MNTTIGEFAQAVIQASIATKMLQDGHNPADGYTIFNADGLALCGAVTNKLPTVKYVLSIELIG